MNLPARIVSPSGEAPGAALPPLPALRASAHGPRGEDGAGRRPEESGGCPRAPRGREPFPLRLLLLLLLAPGCEQLAAFLRLLLPGPLRPGVPVQVLRQNLLLLGSLCQLHLRLRPGLGGRPVPTLPGQVQVSLCVLPVSFPPFKTSASSFLAVITCLCIPVVIPPPSLCLL